MRFVDKKITFKKYGEKYNIVLIPTEGIIPEYTECEEIAVEIGINDDEVKTIVESCNGKVVELEKSNMNLGYNNDNSNNEADCMNVITFDSESDCNNVIDILMQEKKITKLFKDVQLLEEKYNSTDRRTRDDIKSCYTDSYILDIWGIERYDDGNYEGFNTFEDFLLDFIEQNIRFE